MKTVMICIVALLSFLHPHAQDINAMLKEADRLEAVPDENGAYQKFKDILKLKPTNLHALSKCSELCSRIGKRQTDPKIRDSYYDAAKIYAQTALRIDPANADASCSMAMALGRSSMSKSGKEKINTAKEIRKYVDIALKTNPNHFLAWHILGRWHYEISNLNFFERTAVKLFYGGMPESSLDESIAAFEKSQSIVSGFILNYFELAKAYHRNDQNDKAIATLKVMLTLPNQTEDDSATKEEGKRLLKDWQ
jgi:tetratricopeptide (TPR) repeat protein